MSDRAVIREKIIRTLQTVEPGVAGARITDATSLSELKIDSLRLIELGVLLEDEFGKSVRFDEWLEQERARGRDAYTLESLITFVDGRGNP